MLTELAGHAVDGSPILFLPSMNLFPELPGNFVSATSCNTANQPAIQPISQYSA